MYLVSRSNDAVLVNPPFGTDIHITSHGSDWYWTVFSIMALSTIAIVGTSFTAAASNRLFHYTTAATTLISALTYFTLASDLGFTGIPVEFLRLGTITSGSVRQIFYVRYIQWFLTTPIILTNLFATAGLPWQQIVYLGLVNEVSVVSALSGALVRTVYKWGYYTFGLTALLYVLYHIAVPARTNAARLGSDVSRAYLLPASVVAVAGLLYPIAWGVSEGGNVIHPDSEAAFYGVLDILAIPVSAGLLLWAHRGIEPARLGLHLHSFIPVSSLRGEKASEPAAAI